MDRRRQAQHGDLQLNVEDAENRAEWRRRTRVADPSPEGSTGYHSLKEREGERAGGGSTSAHSDFQLSNLLFYSIMCNVSKLQF